MTVNAKWYQKRVAQTAIGGSTLRGHPKGTVDIVRKYLEGLNLQDFHRADQHIFNSLLNRHTHALQHQIKRLDSSAQYWGSARKALNIFLAEASYHFILRKQYALNRIDRYLEVPLDKQVAHALRSKAGSQGKHLPPFFTLKGLSDSDNVVYQEFASEYARERRCKRVELDLYLWRRGGKPESVSR